MIGSCWVHSLSLRQPATGLYHESMGVEICVLGWFGLQAAICTVVCGALKAVWGFYIGFPFRFKLDLI